MTRSRMVFGITFIAVGAMLLLEQADVLDAAPLLADWWPTVIILAGLAQFVLTPRNPVGAGIVGLIGVALLFGTLDIVDTVRLVWPLLLIGLGLWLLTRRTRTPSQPAAASREWATTGSDASSGGGRAHAVAGASTAPVQVEGGVTAVFDDRDVRVTPGPWNGQTVTTIFGDVELDLTAATIAQREVLQVTAIFGDVRVDVPASWRITVSGPEVFGNVSVGPVAEPEVDAPVLHLQVVTIFGDVKVHPLAVASPV